ncbi:Utp14-domain-containing protein [Fistulina hepatica ATCC 64428]|uniref:Utp14-domain-containing protein n=1 Tax=Fistulina hepatica ATCC 64428 TaxID=1128425 RepID=A0A0D7AIQ8_9AGAR|nr:Utp14-domain-containing protein [Fistulina hepatica ATCC 64428]
MAKKISQNKSSTSHRTNASGYAQRQAKKAAKLTASDVYEYAPDTHHKSTRRAKIKMDFDPEEIMGIGGEEREELRARLIGENSDDEIDSEDDDEIDSDDAFEESDQDRYAGFFSSKGAKSQRKKRVDVVDLNEDDDNEESENGEEDDEEGEAGEFFDVLDVLDGRANIDDDEKPPTTVKSAKPDDMNVDKPTEVASDDEMVSVNRDTASQEDDDDDDESDISGNVSPDEDVADPSGALDALENFINALPSEGTSDKKRKTSSGAPDEPPPKRRIIAERTETGQESEFRASASGSKLQLEDLIAPFQSSSDATSLLSAVKVLAATSNNKSKTKARTLDAPLPQRAQEKLEREAAYEQTKQEVDKWSDTMKQIREAEHLSFPLQAPPVKRNTSADLVAKFKPSTEMESSIDNLLKKAKIREAQLEQTEDSMLQDNKLTAEEVAARRAELRKIRELMFRAEVKAKRINKIKSKTYRKIRRRERAKYDIDMADVDDEEARLKMEADRARERATLRHKNTGKWARSMRGKHGIDNGREAVEEMLDRGERLRRRIQGIGSGSEDEDSDEEAGDDNGDDVETIRRSTFDELDRFHNAAPPDDTADGETTKSKGLFAMKFMKDAIARQEQENKRLEDDFRREMKGLGETDDNGNDSDVEPSNSAQDIVTERVGNGRLSFRPGSSITNPTVQLAQPVTDDTPATPAVDADDEIAPTAPRRSSPAPQSNPWLTSVASASAPRKNEVLVSKNSTRAAKVENKLKKQAGARKATTAAKDAEIEIDVTNVLRLDPVPTAETQSKKKKALRKRKQAKANEVAADGAAHDDQSDENSELEEQEAMLEAKGKGKAKFNANAFQQRDLVAMAFAGDNVVREFEEAKRQAVEEDAPQEIDTTLPGWGSWGGTGTTKPKKKPHLIKKIAGVDPTQRADYGKKHVIISEKRDKKAAKYLVKDLPYPYTSQAQFERSMQRPIGAEWNTRLGFQRQTLPRVVKKMGAIIEPLEKQH